MKKISKTDHKKSTELTEKAQVELVRPTKAALNRAIEKSIKKNRTTLEILAKR